ncbi:acyltransferase family protein [Micrococcus luteus]|uniref:acyltransferase family protein n=1 Tax=Micrococcus luteus TaxID=1270 RepID=UPI0016433671|nr:acyltransferase family protein [Micrococcus luteus]
MSGNMPILSKDAMFDVYRRSFYRADVQGIRALSAIMIMTYHIWIDAVSGGVDVFFVISGFLVATTMLKQVAVDGRVKPVQFWKGIIARVFPSAYLILVLTAVLTTIFVPVPLWKFATNEFVAAAFSIENLELIRRGVDYLDREAPPSQFQQFWALSLQIQFYVGLPFLIAAGVLLSKAVRRRWPLLLVIGTMAFGSFTYSVHFTAENPAGAYFHPAPRAWEFLAGVVLAVVYPFLMEARTRAGRLLAIGLGGYGLLVVLFLGIILPATVQFPGWVALLPVSAALCLLVSGRVAPAAENPVAGALSAAPLVAIGAFSFTLYLWHWPVLVFARYLNGGDRLSLFAGLAVAAVSLALAYGTSRLVEQPTLRWAKRGGSPKSWRPALVLCTVAALVGGAAVGARQGLIVYSNNYNAVASSPVHASGLIEPDARKVAFQDWLTVDYDRPRGLSGCLSRRCEGGDSAAERTVVIIGDSHSAQYYDLLDAAGRQSSFRVVQLTGELDVQDMIERESPDVVVTVGTATTEPAVGHPEVSEEGKVQERLHQLADASVELILIRDNPRFSSYQNACLFENQDEPDECAVDRGAMFADSAPWGPIAERNGVHTVDLTDMWCRPYMCPAITGDTLMYYDRHHFSQSYLQEFGPTLYAEMVRQAPGVLTK